MRIGYAGRCPETGAEKQREALLSAGCEMTLGGGIASLLAAASAGDTVVVATLAAFGSTPVSAVRAALEVKERGADLVVLNRGIDTSREEHRLFFQHAAAVAGVGSAKRAPSKPRHTGGKPKVDPSALANAVGMYESGEYKMSEISAATGISKSTLYRNLARPGDGDG